MIIVSVTTKSHGTDRYHIKRGGMYVYRVYGEIEIPHKIPQMFAVLWHIFKKRGVYKDRVIEIGFAGSACI